MRWRDRLALATPARPEPEPRPEAAAEPAGWDANDWRAFVEERAAIMEHDGEVPRAIAEARAYDDAVREWLARHPPEVEDGTCPHCGGRASAVDAVPVRFGGRGAVGWLHLGGCAGAHWLRRRARARAALAALGIAAPEAIGAPEDRAEAGSEADDDG